MWQPNVNVTVEAHEYLARHADELLDPAVVPKTKRAVAVKRQLMHVLQLLDALSELGNKLEERMLSVAELAENGVYEDDSDVE